MRAREDLGWTPCKRGPGYYHLTPETRAACVDCTPRPMEVGSAATMTPAEEAYARVVNARSEISQGLRVPHYRDAVAIWRAIEPFISGAEPCPQCRAWHAIGHNEAGAP